MQVLVFAQQLFCSSDAQLQPAPALQVLRMDLLQLRVVVVLLQVSGYLPHLLQVLLTCGAQAALHHRLLQNKRPGNYDFCQAPACKCTAECIYYSVWKSELSLKIRRNSRKET